MKLRTMLIVAHLASALAGSAATGLALALAPGLMTMIVALAAALLLAVAGAWLLHARIARGLQAIQRAVATGSTASLQTVGIQDLDQLLHRLRDQVQRWSEAANQSREQFREVELILGQLQEKSSEREPRTGNVGTRLRQKLALLGESADHGLRQMLQCTREIRRCTQEIARGAEEQNSVVHRTTTYVEQMSANIDAIAKNAERAQQAAVEAQQAATQGVQLMQDLLSGIEKIDRYVEAGETRLRSLGDHSHQIQSIVETISTIAARTDMLALNVSIESVRAGEHGRGFAVVADEVRKLAEQTAHASREVAGLVEAMQLETQESINAITQERSAVAAELQRVDHAGHAMQDIDRISREAAEQANEITQATRLQLQLTHDVVVAVEQISEVSQAGRTRAEKVSWTINNLGRLAQDFNTSLAPLRGCGTHRHDLLSRELDLDATDEEDADLALPLATEPAAASDAPVAAG